MNAKGSLISCIISVLSIVTAAGGVIICAYISLDGITGTAVYTAAYFFIGCAGGLMNSVRAYRTREITLNSGAPRGIADNFYNLMLVISFAAACVIALPVFFTAAAVVPFIAAGAAAVFQLIFAVTAYRAGGLTMQSVGLFDAKEIMRSIENKKTDDEKLAELIAELDRTEADGD
jgi:hypothetical protein